MADAKNIVFIQVYTKQNWQQINTTTKNTFNLAFPLIEFETSSSSLYFGYTIKATFIVINDLFLFLFHIRARIIISLCFLLFHMKAHIIISLDRNSFQLSLYFSHRPYFLVLILAILASLSAFFPLQACQSTSFLLIIFCRSRKGLKIIIIIGEFTFPYALKISVGGN